MVTFFVSFHHGEDRRLLVKYISLNGINLTNGKIQLTGKPLLTALNSIANFKRPAFTYNTYFRNEMCIFVLITKVLYNWGYVK